VNREGIVLFIHILGVVALFGGLVLFQNTGRRLRAAPTWVEARAWLSLLRQVPGMFIGGSVVLLASGLELAREQWGFTTPWVVVAIFTVVSAALFAIFGLRPSLAKLGAMARSREGVIPTEMRVVFTSPSLWSPLFAMNGAVLGVLWLMTNKPGWTVSLGVPLALAAVGAVLGRALYRPGIVGADRDATRPAMGGGLAPGRSRTR
jgi:hypothetical protein